MEPPAGRVRIDKAVFHIDSRAEGRHALYMLVYRAHAEVAAAGHSRLGAAEAAKHSADEVIRRPYLAHKLIRGILKMHVRAVYLDR